LLWVLLVPCWVQAAELAVVIDDVGYSKARGMRAIKLPGPVTIAVLPFAPHTSSLVQHAILVGKDIIVHQPMEPRPSKHAREEHGTLKLNMPAPEFNALVAAALDAVPQRIGVSNHTGSLLTAHRAPMIRFMRQLNSRGLFFLDSRTTAATVALTVAQEQGVPALKRDVFLDNERTTHAINRSFELALKVARRNGSAVLIAHPYDVSLDYLEDRLAELPADIQLVAAAELAHRAKSLSYPGVLAQQPSLASPGISPGR
jgi:polysaccharide deacetylase 2 family uncharacterized protein YibQ